MSGSSSPPLDPNEELEYEIDVSTPGSDTDVFSEKGSYWGFPAIFPIEHVKLTMTAPEGHRIVITNPVVVWNASRTANQPEKERHTPEPQLNRSGTVLSWELPMLDPGTGIGLVCGWCETILMSDDPVGFRCTACGECCKDLGEDRAVMLNGSDISRLAEALKLNERTFIARFCSELGFTSSKGLVTVLTVKPAQNGHCPFLQLDNKCGVHDVKPHQCKTTPYNFFFEARAFRYECMDAVIPDVGWSSDIYDQEFLNGLTITTCPA